MDVIHGYQTVFLYSIGFIMQLGYGPSSKSASIAASEASADGICWIFSPMVDSSPRSTPYRNTKVPAEDPYLSSQIAKAMVKGYQGDDLLKIIIAVCKTLCVVRSSRSWA